MWHSPVEAIPGPAVTRLFFYRKGSCLLNHPKTTLWTSPMSQGFLAHPSSRIFILVLDFQGQHVEVRQSSRHTGLQRDPNLMLTAPIHRATLRHIRLGHSANPGSHTHVFELHSSLPVSWLIINTYTNVCQRGIWGATEAVYFSFLTSLDTILSIQRHNAFALEKAVYFLQKWPGPSHCSSLHLVEEREGNVPPGIGVNPHDEGRK